MKIIDKKISFRELKQMAEKSFGNLVKGVVDIKKGTMAVDGELHADEEALLIEKGSQQKDLWGINLYPEIKDESWIEFDSMINLRPFQGNRTRGVDDKNTQRKIIGIVNKLVEK